MTNHEAKNETGISRRRFLSGVGGLAAAGAIGMSFAGCSSAAAGIGGSASLRYDEAIKWDTEYDVVVAGWGGAGAVAAITAAENNAQVLIAEKAPYGEEGGNTRYSEQYFCIPDSYETGLEFFTAMTGEFDASPEIIELMARGSAECEEWLMAHGATRFAPEDLATKETGIDKDVLSYAELDDWMFTKEDGGIGLTEYPIWPDGTPNNERISMLHQVDEPDGNQKKYWKLLRDNVEALKDDIDVWFESPAIKLIQDPFTKTVLGVVIERKGESLNVRARNGVVLACGSYEANRQMVANFTQISVSYPLGTLYNTGDGVKMGMDVGADMWHMKALSGPWITPKYKSEDRGVIIGGNVMARRVTTAGSCFYVGSNAKRFVRESSSHKHGHIDIGGTWMNQPIPEVMWAIMDAEARNNGGTITAVDADDIVEGATIAELAEKIGVDPATLEETTATYNAYAAKGNDQEFHRSPAGLVALGEAPYYAVRLWPAFANCQGGPRRNTNCEVVDTDGNAIPHLYSAGELGSFWAGVYIAGGNIAETLYSGRIAGENAAKSKGEVEEIALTAVDSSPKELGSDLDESGVVSDIKLDENQYLGVGEGLHGPIAAVVTVVDGKVIAVEVVQQNETPDVTTEVWSKLPEAIVAAGGVEVDVISGATIASEGLITAVEDAVVQA